MRALWLLLLLACGGDGEPKPKPKAIEVPKSTAPPVEQVKPKLDVKTPPPDAAKTPTGIVYKKLVENPSGVAPKRNDTVAINYTTWKQATGETVFTNRVQGQPMIVSLASTTSGFTEALQLLHKGETAMLWIPPALGDKGARDTMVYEMELVEVVPAPPVPPDLDAPPATAKPTKHGAKYVIVTPGEGAPARSFDTVTFDYTAWTRDGRMFESTEMRKRPATAPPFRQPAVIEDVLLLAGKGARIRVWADATQIAGASPPAGTPAGPLVYEIAIASIAKAANAPWPVPPDVAAAPADAKQSPRGVAYKLLAAGKGGSKPAPTDAVQVNYTAWTTDGRIIAASQLEGHPVTIALNGTIAGLTDAIPLMSVGDRMRLWIPDALAYKGAPGQPQGTIVYDLELVAIDARPTEVTNTDAPPDVAAPPANANQTPSGVAYKILRAKPGGKRPTPKDTVRVIFSGWTTDGKLFDSSKGQPYEAKLTNMIDGWAEAVPMLAVGEKARLWIPERLAYAGAEGSPRGMLVFDIELLEIVK